MALQIDEVIYDPITEDPASPAEGQVWYNSTDKQFKKYRNGVVETSAMQSDIQKELAVAWDGSVSGSTTSYETVARVIFSGTGRGTPTAVKGIASLSAAVTGYIRVYDITNDVQICEASTTTVAKHILSLGTLSNLSSGAAIWEIQIKTSSNSCSLHNLAVIF